MQGLDLGARDPTGPQQGARRGSPCHLSFCLPRVRHSGEAGVGWRGLGASAGASSTPPPFPHWVPGLRCYAGLMPGPGCSHMALDLKQQAQARQAGESHSPSPGGPPGGWSLSPLGPRLATKLPLSTEAWPAAPRSHWPWGSMQHAGPVRLRAQAGPARLKLALGTGSLASGLCPARPPSQPPTRWVPCVSPGPPHTLLISGSLDWEPHSGQPPRQIKGPS